MTRDYDYDLPQTDGPADEKETTRVVYNMIISYTLKEDCSGKLATGRVIIGLVDNDLKGLNG